MYVEEERQQSQRERNWSCSGRDACQHECSLYSFDILHLYCEYFVSFNVVFCRAYVC